MRDKLGLIDFTTTSEHRLGLPKRELPAIAKQRRRKSAKSSLNPFAMCGADTETVGGKIWLFSTENGVYEIDTFTDLIKVLYDKDHTSTWKKGKKSARTGSKGSKGSAARGISVKQFFFYNLKYDCQAVFRTLPDELVLILLTGDTGHITVTIDGVEVLFKLKYLEGKMLEIKPIKWVVDGYKKGVCVWWDISQFYNKKSLNDASLTTLNESKLEVCFDGSKLDIALSGADTLEGAEYRDLYREDIEKYALQDAILTGRLARHKRQEFVDSQIRFIRPYSVANVAQRNLIDCGYKTTINEYMKSDWGKDILRVALTSFQGGWFETSGSGFCANIQGLDLASAYPYICRWLQDIEEGYWVKGDEPEGFTNWLKKAERFSLGFAEISVVFDDGLDFYPLLQLSRKGTLVSPRIVRGWFSAEEIREALQWPHSQFLIGEYYYFKPESTNYPMREYIDRCYHIKHNSAKGSIEYATSKLLLNSPFGKQIQCIDNRAGSLYNPIYASTITGCTRARIAELIRVNEYKALSIATDGVLFKADELKIIPNRPLDAPYNLGQWEFDCEGDLLILMSGVYSVLSPAKTKTTFRGTASYFLRGIESGLFGFCVNHKDDSKKVVFVNKPFSAKEARAKSDLSLINVFTERPFTLSASGDTNKRVWGYEVPVTFGDLLETWWSSRPHQQVEGILRGG